MVRDVGYLDKAGAFIKRDCANVMRKDVQTDARQSSLACPVNDAFQQLLPDAKTPEILIDEHPEQMSALRVGINVAEADKPIVYHCHEHGAGGLVDSDPPSSGVTLAIETRLRPDPEPFGGNGVGEL